MFILGITLIVAGILYIKKPEILIEIFNYIKKISDKTTMFYNVRIGILLIILGLLILLHSLRII